MITLLPIIVQLVQLGIAIAPDLIAAGKLELDLLNPNAPPMTDDQRAQIDAALEDAHNALQAAQPAP